MSRKLKKIRAKNRRSKPFNLAAEFNLAFSLHQAGNLDQAEVIYKKIIQADSLHSDAMNLLANIHLQRGDFGRARDIIFKAIKLQPNRPDYHSNLGSAFRGLKNSLKAIKAYQSALSYMPDHFESQFNLACVYFENGNLESAAEAFSKTIHLKPRFPAAHEQLAEVFRQQGNIDQAIECYDTLLSIVPDNAAFHRKKGDLLQSFNKLDAAEKAYRKAIELAPTKAASYNNLGNVLIKQHRLHDSIQYYQRAIDLDPNLGEAYVNLSWVYKEHGMIDQDIACLQKYLSLHPESSQAHSDTLFSMNYSLSLTPQELYTEACKWWKQHGILKKNQYSHTKSVGQKTSLRIGFLSPDFRKHPVGTFLLPLLKNISPEVEVYCFAEMHENQFDEITTKIIEFVHWEVSSGLSAEACAKLVHSHGIDILIDLAGHSANNRLDIISLRPAPIQISWLGYVNTTGLPVIDFRITDSIADPEGAERFYSEELLRMPDTFFCYTPDERSPLIGELPAISARHVTFGSFNNIAKINDKVIELWTAILNQVEGAQLIMVGRPFRDPDIQNRYFKKFSSHGIERNRIRLIADLPMKEYLELYNKIDIALDPFPHNGHTITCHTLWMGVPVIVLSGERYASRMGTSVLTAMGLPELIASDYDEYINIAVNLAANREKMASLRKELREKMRQAPFCNTTKFAQDFLSLIDIAWHKWMEAP